MPLEMCIKGRASPWAKVLLGLQPAFRTIDLNDMYKR